MSLNDGYKDETPSKVHPKKEARSHTDPRVLPQQHGYLLNKRMNLPESTALDANTQSPDPFTAIPTPSTSTLEGVPNVDEQLRDLVLLPS